MASSQRLLCPCCKTALRIGDAPAGKKLRCPKCKHAFAVPSVTEDAHLQPEQSPGVLPAAQTAVPAGSPQAARGRARQGLSEIRAAAAASAGQMARLWKAGKNKLVKRRLQSQAQGTLAALGEKLHKAGVGDPELRARLTGVNEEILARVAARSSPRLAAAEQLGLRIRIAEPFLTQTAPHGTESEHQSALAAHQALHAHLASRAEAAPLLPTSRRDRIRVAAMAGAAVLVIVVVAVGVRSASGGHSATPLPESAASAAEDEHEQAAPTVVDRGDAGAASETDQQPPSSVADGRSSAKNQEGDRGGDRSSATAGNRGNNAAHGMTRRQTREEMNQALRDAQAARGHQNDNGVRDQQRNWSLANGGRMGAMGLRRVPQGRGR